MSVAPAAPPTVSAELPLTRGRGMFRVLPSRVAALCLVELQKIRHDWSELITRLPHPPELLTHSNAQHGRLVRLLRERDTTRAVRLMRDHIEGTEHILAGLIR